MTAAAKPVPYRKVWDLLFRGKYGIFFQQRSGSHENGYSPKRLGGPCDRRRTGRHVFRHRRGGKRRESNDPLQEQNRRLRQLGGGHVGAPVRTGCARPARGLPRPVSCLRRRGAGREDCGIFRRSCRRGHGTAARAESAAGISDAFGKRRGIPVSRLLQPQAGTHSHRGCPREAAGVSQYHRGRRCDRLRYPHREWPRAGCAGALRRGSACIPGQNRDPLLRRRGQYICCNEQHARSHRRRLRYGCALRPTAARHGVCAVLSLPHLFAQAGGHFPGSF